MRFVLLALALSSVGCAEEGRRMNVLQGDDDLSRGDSLGGAQGVGATTGAETGGQASAELGGSAGDAMRPELPPLLWEVAPACMNYASDEGGQMPSLCGQFTAEHFELGQCACSPACDTSEAPGEATQDRVAKCAEWGGECVVSYDPTRLVCLPKDRER